MPGPAREWELGFHVLDLEFLRGELVPWLLGRDGEPPGREAAGRVLANRLLANAWGLALRERYQRRAWEVALAAQGGGSWAHRLFGIPPVVDTHGVDLSAEFGAFDPDLHVTGRPFLITARGREDVLHLIDRFLHAGSAAEVTQLVSLQLETVPVAVREGLAPEVPVVDPDAAFAEAETLRGWIAEREDPEIRENLLEGLLPALVEVASASQPVWMARGPVWPSRLLEEAGVTFLRMDDGFFLLGELRERLPAIGYRIERTLAARRGIGAVVLPEHVPEFRRVLGQHRAALASVDPAAPHALALLDECLDYATTRRLAFVESAGLFSAQRGVIG